MPEAFRELFYRIAASGYVPRRFFAPDLPPTRPEPPSDRPLRLEIVSHCWRYSSLLNYQLSSLVLHPPQEATVRMTVFFSEEDSDTRKVLDAFGGEAVPGVEWNWWPLEPGQLFRRSIGRNLAAKSTDADWIWFTDCDVVFHDGALDSLATQLRGRQDFLVYPREHRVSEVLPGTDPIIDATQGRPAVLDIAPERFEPEERNRAVGAFQIVRGDVARTAGYCPDIALYQRPAASWRKTFEDRTFRWLLGTQGTPLDIPGIYRIRHSQKGRKGQGVGA